ncbi:glutamate racemase [Enterobacteriaceae endosymbiont of Macroplea appendiculata]|uniref:glutamate racemase n=1 Tax=Enterobacteriaceae endosymbiont of Macroplea appendiculata TaxID=2675790 RepID=UPI001456C814|nr:glutamate racemase [Enterobacteriaceae endosymbiont of Macroplea appendiculata]
MYKILCLSQLNIFIFDSGIGGLSIYNFIKNKFQNINFIYLLDNAYFPYGNKSKSFIQKRLLKILFNVSYKYNITLAIIGCNTASVSSLPYIRRYFNFPIIGISPMFDKAIKTTKNNVIGIIATNTTINNVHIQKKINLINTNRQYLILSLASQRLVYFAEQKITGKNNSIKILYDIFNTWYHLPVFPDSIILGCTHFLFIKDELKKIFPIHTIFIDSNHEVLLQLQKIIQPTSQKYHLQKNIFLYTKKTLKIKCLKDYIHDIGFHFSTKIKLI